MTLLKKVSELEHTADAFGFRWETTTQIMEQIYSECAEINEHLVQGLAHANQCELQHEIGDLLHAVFSLCVFCQFEPEDTLAKTLTKFENRLNAVKQISQEQGLNTLEGKPFKELMSIWNMAKLRAG